MNDRSRLNDRSPWLRAAVLALGLATASASAHAQTATYPAEAKKAGPPTPAPAAAPNSVEGVTVSGRRSDTGAPIPDDKKAAYDQEAAREAAFREYRESRPPISPDAKGVSDPNDLSRDYPGLQSYLPPQ